MNILKLVSSTSKIGLLPSIVLGPLNSIFLLKSVLVLITRDAHLC